MGFIPWIIVGLLAIGGGTSAMADNAVPGNALYGIDQRLEQFQEKFMLWSEGARVKFHEQVSEERLEELETLQNAQPEDVTTIAQDLWAKHIAEAVARIESRIERLHELQAELTAKLELATTDKEKERIQKWLDRLVKLEEHRTDKLTKVEDREFPGAAAVIKRIEHFSEWQDLPKIERDQLKEEARERIRANQRGRQDLVNGNKDDTDQDADDDQDEDSDDDDQS